MANEVKIPNLETFPREGHKTVPGERVDTNDPPRKGVIRMIAGGSNGGDSHHSRKSQVREAYDITMKEVLDVEAIRYPLIQFGWTERAKADRVNSTLNCFISKAAEKSLPFFKVLRKAKKFEWDTSYEQAFEELKKYLLGLPLLVKPIQGNTLYLSLSTTPQAVSSVLIREDGGKQMPIYYVNKTSGKSDTSSQLVKWVVELSEYDISYIPRTTIKAHALAEFVSEMAGTPTEEAPKAKKWLLYVDGSSTT
ncbi:UNVERIFIED_CONTAM: hypothetical protein Scaly_1791600 [Sesamum calycinum]|uniref:Reverse transcriptase/retrotransposon-derived protein RNase H-like domain-containing protein n=1 Tax=Sesamum calycinum TaxID=2727403 RepID=A0AAW2NZD0_9LAMI